MAASSAPNCVVIAIASDLSVQAGLPHQPGRQGCRRSATRPLRRRLQKVGSSAKVVARMLAAGLTRYAGDQQPPQEHGHVVNVARRQRGGLPDEQTGALAELSDFTRLRFLPLFDDDSTQDGPHAPEPGGDTTSERDDLVGVDFSDAASTARSKENPRGAGVRRRGARVGRGREEPDRNGRARLVATGDGHRAATRDDQRVGGRRGEHGTCGCRLAERRASGLGGGVWPAPGRGDLPLDDVRARRRRCTRSVAAADHSDRIGAGCRRE
jgi:hypothetical protein